MAANRRVSVWRRFRITFIGGVILPWGLMSAGQANGDTPDLAELLQKNPILRVVATRAPDRLAEIRAMAEELARGGRLGSVRAGMTPTPTERAQIPSNPVFVAAFAHNPDQTVALLRMTNRAIKDDD